MANTTLIPTIFHEEWWLNTATNGDYKIAEVKSGKDVIGRLPYYRSRRKGLRWGGLPTMTHFLGPAVDEGTGNINTRFIRHLETTRELIQQLPPADYIQVKCHRGIRDVLPFQDQKFRTTVQFTHEILPAPVDELWNNVYTKKRRVISRAQETTQIGIFDDPKEFMRFYDANLEAQGLKNKLNQDNCIRIMQTCLANNRGRICATFDEEKNLAAALFYVWDDNVAYLLLTTRAQSSGSGDISALLWMIMKDSSERNLILDFGGLASAGSAFFYSGFGGAIEPRFVATKTTLPIKLAVGLMSLMGKEQFFY